jgi:hypothetical protein
MRLSSNSTFRLQGAAFGLILVASAACTGAVEPVDTVESAAPTESAYSFDCPQLDGIIPLPEVRAAIDANEQAFLKAALAGDRETLDGLLSDSMSYVHENGQVSTKQQFFDDYLSVGYEEAVSVPKEDMRQFCSSVFRVYNGYLRLKGEGEYPTTSITHIWAKQGEKWVLVHRHESHKGPAIGPQLPQEGNGNDTDKVGAQPTPDVLKTIQDNEAAWVAAMIATDRETMEGLVGPSLHYVHVTDHTSTREDFMIELMGGFTETDFEQDTYRQFGNTVVALHNAHYRHVNEDDQSRSQAMHTWVKQGDKWVLVARHSARFLPY